MTDQDLKIQELRREVSRLRNILASALGDLNEIIVNCELCRYCKYIDADCTPTNGKCVPKWRGL